MTEIALLKMGHVLGLVYWLGADLGVFYSSFVLADDSKLPEVRVSAAKILFTLDLAPRVCMTLMLPLGVHLAARLGHIDGLDWVVPASWSIGLLWLAMVLALYFLAPARNLRILTQVDFWFRVALIAALAGIGLSAVTGFTEVITSWAGWKLTVFAALVLCGLAVRIRLRPFAPAFSGLAQGRHTPEDDRTIRRSIAGTRPFVLLIWLGLLLNTALGVHLL